jgi:hypothetical protein
MLDRLLSISDFRYTISITQLSSPAAPVPPPAAAAVEVDPPTKDEPVEEAITISPTPVPVPEELNQLIECLSLR